MKRGRLLIAGLAMAGLIVAASGCSESESDSDSAALLSPAGSVVATEAAAWIPDISEIGAAVEMTAEQKEAIAAVLVEVRQSAGPANVEGRPGRMQGGRGGMQGRGAGRMGAGDLPDREPPFYGFLEKCSEILEPAQFAKFLNLLSERHEAHREAMEAQRGERPRHGMGRESDSHGPGPDMLDRVADELDLTAEQQAALDALRDEIRQTMQDHREQCRSSETPREECRGQAAALHEQFRARLAEILTPEQLAELEELRNARRADRMEEMQAGADERLDRAVGFLVKTLDLDDSQAAAVREIMDATHEQIQTLHESVRNDETERDAVREQGDRIRDETAASIRALLSEDQAAVFDALAGFLPGHGPGHGFGGKVGKGCGGGGPWH